MKIEPAMFTATVLDLSYSTDYLLNNFKPDHNSFNFYNFYIK